VKFNDGSFRKFRPSISVMNKTNQNRYQTVSVSTKNTALSSERGCKGEPDFNYGILLGRTRNRKDNLPEVNTTIKGLNSDQ